MKWWDWLPWSLQFQSSVLKSRDITSPTKISISLVSSVAQLYPTVCDNVNARLPWPSPTPGACSNSCPSSWWCHPTISSSVNPFSSSLQSFLASGSFPMSQFFGIMWPKYWNFSISLSDEYSGLLSFRIDWFDILTVQGTLKSFLQNHNSKASILQHSASFTVQLSHLYVTTGKNHSFDCMHLCQQNDASAF